MIHRKTCVVFIDINNLMNLVKRNRHRKIKKDKLIAFHTLAKDDMSKDIGATHFTLYGNVLSRPSYYKYTCAPPLKITQLRPCG